MELALTIKIMNNLKHQIFAYQAIYCYVSRVAVVDCSNIIYSQIPYFLYC